MGGGGWGGIKIIELILKTCYKTCVPQVKTDPLCLFYLILKMNIMLNFYFLGHIDSILDFLKKPLVCQKKNSLPNAKKRECSNDLIFQTFSIGRCNYPVVYFDQ